ncbi:MAG: putative ABC transporter permease [Bacilli bacterium]|nr:putative ABC transporter permease [Bacilli bacterium]MDD4808884.1 putative ABC transporter permease [Bacilli bacterium]
MNDFIISFLIFLIYSVMGWFIEVIYTFIRKGQLVNRGFLIGPYCPIYGVGAIIMIFLLEPYHDDLLVLFVMSMVICTIMEYFTSYLMEKIFKARWWDYSHLAFNVNGRVCLTNAIEFGLLSVVLIAFVHGPIINFISNIPPFALGLIFGLFFGIFSLDLIISINIIKRIKNTVTNIRNDHTVEINEKVKKILNEKSFLFRRVFEAFPNLNTLVEKTKKFKLPKRKKDK